MNRYNTFTGCEHWYGAELDLEGPEYLVKEVNQYLQQFITNAKHVLRYGTALEAREYMINEIMKMEKEFNLQGVDL